MTTFGASWQAGGDRAPLREEPTPSRERRRSCACAHERAPLSARRSHVPKSPGGLLDHGDSGGSGTPSRRWRHANRLCSVEMGTLSGFPNPPARSAPSKARRLPTRFVPVERIERPLAGSKPAGLPLADTGADPEAGIEPATHGFRGRYASSCATREWCPLPESNRALRGFGAALVPRELEGHMRDLACPAVFILFSCQRATSE
jgi:hypothetical protein